MDDELLKIYSLMKSAEDQLAALKQATGALSSHSFAKNLKAYASAAGLGPIHVHQLRHTFARLVGEDEGDLTKVQHALGHKNLSTTRVYLPRVTTKRDTFSAGIARRLGLNGDK